MKKVCISVYTIMIFTAFSALRAEVDQKPDQSTALVVGMKVRLRSGDNLSSDIVALLNTGTVVRVLAKSEKPVKLSQKGTYSYYWYQIKCHDGLKGWIYGQFLYLFNQGLFNAGSAEFSYKGTKYQLAVFNEKAVYDYAPDDDIFIMPVLYEVSRGSIHILHASNSVYKKIKHRSLNPDSSAIFRFIGNMGFSEGFSGLPNVIGDYIHIPVKVSMQEGTASYEMKVILKGKQFWIEDIINYRRNY